MLDLTSLLAASLSRSLSSDCEGRLRLLFPLPRSLLCPFSLFSSPSLRFPKREAVFTFVVGGDHINRRPPVAVLRRLYPICCRFFLRPLPFCISRQSFPRRCLPEPLVDPSWDRAMIKLFKIKDQKREDAANSSGRAPVKKQSAGELRLHKDISELNLPKSTVISFPNGKDDLMNFEISIRPDEGYYQGGTFVFTFQVSPSYPHEPPKVKCKTKVYHPNIDLEGNVCLNILREDWKPVLNINTVVYGLILLFMQPNDEDPLNHDAAAVLRDNPRLFETNVRRAMAGGYVGQIYFPRCI
ncbi:NEDD8-conjugating enzyme [Musa troglodytarum]|uniref:NEDD8-conjugating enzyme n=2 Tax=Musa troglodytarum TaxID=320322 RepID=A0A9E7HPH6_9LILI|nr:NEDD8-conjugating enzyme [Musa troglodytarum]